MKNLRRRLNIGRYLAKWAKLHRPSPKPYNPSQIKILRHATKIVKENHKNLTSAKPRNQKNKLTNLKDCKNKWTRNNRLRKMNNCRVSRWKI